MILKLVAERLRAVVRNGPDAVARLGGDEFVVLLSDTDRDGAEQWARRATEIISQPYAVEGRHVTIGVSMGIAIAPRDGNAQDRLLKNADLALYRAKRESGSTFRFYEEGMDARLRQRNALEMDLREALQRREFEVHYQPVIAAADRRVVGFEALLRWRRRGRRMVAPSEFIPLAEETSLIVPIGEWALAQACAEAATWPSDLLLAVNVSAVQFQRSDFAGKVAEALASSGLPAHRLELEITETVLMDHADSVLPTITALKRMGVRIALDDFGTGYSSLSYLRKFPFDRIKIDRSFIAEIDNADTAAIVATIVGLGRRLGMATTAEGVETVEQLQMARAAGCSDAQGYLISPAVPRDRIAGLLGQELCSPAA
jgi:predicted signal transduction protein with EAL and GGDEF domain